MGRHEAADDAATHPLVADALQHRPPDAPHGVHEAQPLPGSEGPVGWPGPDPGGSGEPVGWPAGPPGDPGTGERSVAPATRSTGVGHRWRRQLPGRPATA